MDVASNDAAQNATGTENWRVSNRNIHGIALTSYRWKENAYQNGKRCGYISINLVVIFG